MARIALGLLFALSMTVGTLGTVGCGDDTASKPTGTASPTATLSCSSSGPCDVAETEQYGKCIQGACDAGYVKCFGPGYASGDFGGPCGSYYGCLAKCSCDDAACRSSCGAAPAECQLCIGNDITGCAANSGCKEPSCTGGQVTAPATCDDLAKCCASIGDQTNRSLCETELDGAKKYGDVICDSFVRGFRQLGACQ